MFRIVVSPTLTVAISVNALFPSLNRIQIEKYMITSSLPQPPHPKKEAKKEFHFPLDVVLLEAEKVGLSP